MTSVGGIRVGVVVPARDESEHIDACLTAITLAAGWAEVPVTVVVVADGCLDDTAARARRHPGVTVLETPGSNVGGARAAGSRLALRRGASWLAHTDADSVVPANWITTQLDLARGGAEVVIGAVHPRFADLTAEEVEWWHRTHDDGQALGNIHGANLGMTAAAYRRVGGFLSLPEHEDTDLVSRLRRSGAVVAATERGSVETSGRHVGRTPGGYARYLREDLPRIAAVNPVT
ncbi:glycosyltransferase [Pseudolysinimonas sp.]|uniref:glycosyltransferase n=1 Tax=Pseudolysinimonas sp. TaxID=2680009 RepID=UPI00378465E7